MFPMFKKKAKSKKAGARKKKKGFAPFKKKGVKPTMDLQADAIEQ